MTNTSHETEILIIGGGIAGASTALHLAQYGRDVTLLERGEIASEASGVNMGGLGGIGWGNPPDLQGYLTLGSLEIFKTLQFDLGYDIELRQSGALQAIHTEEQYDFARNRVVNMRSQGHEIELLSMREARSLEPHVDPSLLGFLYSPRRGQADPAKATRAFATAAQQQGAHIVTGANVTGIRAGDGVFHVTSSRGDYVAGALVLAAGAWSAPLGAMLGIDIPIVPVRGQMWASEPLPPRVFQTISSMESTLAWHQETITGSTQPPELTHLNGSRVTRHLYGRQNALGEIIFGGDRETIAYDKDINAEGIETNKGHASEILPFLRNLPIKRTWSGLMPFSIDGKPIIGSVPGFDNLYVVTGLASSGFGRGPMAGKLIAELVHTGHPAQVLSESDPARCIKSLG